MSEYKYDILKMYFGEDYPVTDYLIIHQPSIGDIIEFGETRFFSIASLLCANTTSMRLELWDNGYDWNEITDFELFCSLTSILTPDQTYLVFGDFDLSKLRPYRVDDKVILIDPENADIYIDEEIYNKLVGYLRVMFNIHPKVEKAKGKATKEAIIWEERENLRIQELKQRNIDYQPSVLFPLISSVLCHPGCKYKKNELKELGLVEFFDIVERLQVYERSTALLKGIYSGFIDVKGIDKNDVNFMRDLHEQDLNDLNKLN